jgi:hypothetical protein
MCVASPHWLPLIGPDGSGCSGAIQESQILPRFRQCALGTRRWQGEARECELEGIVELAQQQYGCVTGRLGARRRSSEEEPTKVRRLRVRRWHNVEKRFSLCQAERALVVLGDDVDGVSHDFGEKRAVFVNSQPG